MSNLRERLLAVQTELKAPKGQYNNFGKYKYRSCEDILEAVKPLLAEHKLSLTISDDVVEVGSRIYVRAEARISAVDDSEYIVNTAWAREDEAKKGMDGSQITGTASSYARKYCLNGLFLIDDTKDADTDEYQKTAKINDKDVEALRKRFETLNIDEEALCKQYGLKSLKEMSVGQMTELNGKLNKLEKGA